MTFMSFCYSVSRPEILCARNFLWNLWTLCSVPVIRQKCLEHLRVILHRRLIRIRSEKSATCSCSPLRQYEVLFNNRNLIFLCLIAYCCSCAPYLSHVIVVFRVKTRCKHYMIDQTRSGKFVIVGMFRVYKSLKEMVTVHRKVQASIRLMVLLHDLHRVPYRTL